MAFMLTGDRDHRARRAFRTKHDLKFSLVVSLLKAQWHRLMMHDGQTHAWWQTGVIYQIYPRSFQDSDGDGVGDLNGIITRLEYVAALGVDAVWLSPIFPSPMADFGYDVADYCGIEPVFGDLATFDRLLAEAHRRGLKVLLDFVPNHSSDRHPWFVESRASKENPKRDWYIWRDAGPDGAPPNNWISTTSAAVLGSGTREAGNIISTPSCPNSQT